ncbi:hypothetical protein [Tichowtungia aerotolerans]|uniref:Uncharacterized protein n=1 Tax=Tichowtungia aerotolerans TaxID=2697043 RepID=A0A6P1M1J9_9BACT|nr:hypothetical protein [Tichowtungia aerotolerans]QHI68699.1 hypothetical protein GT409_04305 [Tichowtungia aerotolerans]
MQDALIFREEKRRRLLPMVINVSANVMVWGGLCVFGAPLEILWIVVFILVVNGMTYFKQSGREYWVQVSDTSVEYHDSSNAKVSRIYEFSDVKRVKRYYGGITLFLKSGAIRRVNIVALTLSDPKAFKDAFSERWRAYAKEPPPRGAYQ